MLIGNASKKPNVETVRRIKRALHTALALSEEATITVAQLACLEEGVLHWKPLLVCYAQERHSFNTKYTKKQMLSASKTS